MGNLDAIHNVNHQNAEAKHTPARGDNAPVENNNVHILNPPGQAGGAVDEAAKPAPRVAGGDHPPAMVEPTPSQASMTQVETSGNPVRTAKIVGAVKDGLSYVAAAGSVAASGGAAALTQPLFRSAANMLHKAIEAFRAGDVKVMARFGNALVGALKSLQSDGQAVLGSLKNFFKAPVSFLKVKLLNGAEAPKTWGHLGALVGGLIGGIAGGPVFAGVGFVAGRYLGQAIGQFAAYASGNSALTLKETAKQALFAGVVNLNPAETKVKVKQLEDALNKLEGELKASSEEGAPLPATISRDVKEILLLLDVLSAKTDQSDLSAIADYDFKCESKSSGRPDWGRVFEDIGVRLTTIGALYDDAVLNAADAANTQAPTPKEETASDGTPAAEDGQQEAANDEAVPDNHAQNDKPVEAPTLQPLPAKSPAAMMPPVREVPRAMEESTPEQPKVRRDKRMKADESEAIQKQAVQSDSEDKTASKDNNAASWWDMPKNMMNQAYDYAASWWPAK